MQTTASTRTIVVAYRTCKERVNARTRRRRAVSPDLATEESELVCAWLRSNTEKNGKKMRIVASEEDELAFRITKIKGNRNNKCNQRLKSII